jgi:hypothetical protein
VIPGIRIQPRVGTQRSPDADEAARRVNARLRGYCAVFKGRPSERAGTRSGTTRRAPVSQNSTACDALELDGMPSWHGQVRSTY